MAAACMHVLDITCLPLTPTKVHPPWEEGEEEDVKCMSVVAVCLGVLWSTIIGSLSLSPFMPPLLSISAAHPPPKEDQTLSPPPLRWQHYINGFLF